MTRTITIEITRPPLRTRIGWHLQQLRLRVFPRHLTTEEWYAADCPPYAGQQPPWAA